MVKPDCWSVAFGNSYNQEERCIAAGYDNGDIKLFDLRTNCLRWDTNVSNGVCGLEFDRQDITMNKLVATTLESKFHVFDLKTYPPEKGYGRHGLVNQTLVGMGLVQQPVEWLLFSEFSVVLAFVHLYTMFMIVPIFNSMMRIDRSLIEASTDAGATAWQTLWNVIIPLSRTGIIIGSIFVITIVMGDFVTIGVMGGQQIASVGKIIQVQTSFLQFPLAAANAVILLLVVLMIIWGLTRLVDIRKEL